MAPCWMPRSSDFQSGVDRVDLSAMALVFVDDARFSESGQLRVDYTAEGALLLADLDGDGTADLTLMLAGVTGLAAGDLILG